MFLSRAEGVCDFVDFAAANPAPRVLGTAVPKLSRTFWALCALGGADLSAIAVALVLILAP